MQNIGLPNASIGTEDDAESVAPRLLLHVFLHGPVAGA
jgi:hypothetical protein